MKTCTDEEFMEAWRTHQSAVKVARALGISERNIHARRRRIEARTGTDMPCADKVTVAHSQRLDLGILNGTIIVFSDAHFWPGLHSTAYRGLVRVIERLKPQAVINNGDSFDGASISRYPRIGWDKTPSVIEELKANEIALGEIEDTAKKARRNVSLVWCLGNHDARFENRLAANAPEFEQVNGFRLKDHFPEWRPAWAAWNGQTVIKHRYKGGIHATHNNTLNSGASMVTGHLHSLKVTPFSDYNGTRFGVDTGTLADPRGPQFENYLEDGPTNWRSGFAVLTYNDGRLMWPEVATVWDRKHIEFRGQLIEV
jgi:hypothetical protein